MRRKQLRFTLAVVLTLTAQLFLASAAQAQGARLSQAPAAQIGIPYILMGCHSPAFLTLKTSRP